MFIESIFEKIAKVCSTMLYDVFWNTHYTVYFFVMQMKLKRSVSTFHWKGIPPTWYVDSQATHSLL